MWSDGPYLTPTLNFVERWVRVDKLVSLLDNSTFEGLAFELARALKTSFGTPKTGSADVPKGLFLAVEERSSLRVRDALEARFSLRRFSRTTEGGVELAPSASRSTPVVVYADLVSSGESIRRAAQNVLRQGFSVAAVVSLVDMRFQPKDHIVAFGQRIPLIALIHDPNEASLPTSVSVVAPSLLHVETCAPSTAALRKSCQIDRQADPYVWQSLHFRHGIRASGRHVTLTIDPDILLDSKKFVDKLQTTIQSSPLYRAAESEAGAVVILCPLDERDEKWRLSVNGAFAKLCLSKKLVVEFIARTTFGKAQAIDSVSSIGSKLKASSLVLVFDWGVISGKTVDALATEAVQAGADRLLVIVANSQLSPPEYKLRSAITSLRMERSAILTGDLLSTPAKEVVDVPYSFIALSTLPLGQYWGSDCPVCTQADDLLSMPCQDPFITEYREGALRRLQSPGGSLVSDPPLDVVNSIAALCAFLVSAQTTTSYRFAITENIREAAIVCGGIQPVLPIHNALIELLYVEGAWIQLAPIRYRACRDPVATICLHAIRRGAPDTRAKAISVLRRVSKTEFMKQSAEIFTLLGGQSRAQGALLFGIHTYLARRYHETVNMLEPARRALRGLERQLAEDEGSNGIHRYFQRLRVRRTTNWLSSSNVSSKPPKWDNSFLNSARPCRCGSIGSTLLNRSELAILITARFSSSSHVTRARTASPGCPVQCFPMLFNSSIIPSRRSSLG